MKKFIEITSVTFLVVFIFLTTNVVAKEPKDEIFFNIAVLSVRAAVLTAGHLELSNPCFGLSALEIFKDEVEATEEQARLYPFANISSLDAQKSLNVHLIKNGIKEEEIDNFVIYEVLTSFRDSGWSFLGIKFFGEKFITFKIFYYDKRDLS